LRCLWVTKTLSGSPSGVFGEIPGGGRKAALALSAPNGSAALAAPNGSATLAGPEAEMAMTVSWPRLRRMVVVPDKTLRIQRAHRQPTSAGSPARRALAPCSLPSGCLASIEVMQPAHLRELDHGPLVGSHDRPWHRTVLCQRPVSARAVIVGEVFLEHETEMAFAKDNDLIQAFSAQSPDQAFGVRILDRKSTRLNSSH
jgi:hypothetical protein